MEGIKGLGLRIGLVSNIHRIYRLYTQLCNTNVGQNLVSTTVPHFTWVDASNSRKMKLTEPILTNPIHFLKGEFDKEFRNYGRTLETGFLHISGYRRIQATCNSMSLL